MGALRAAYAGFKLLYAIGRILGRFFMGRNGVLSGDRKTNATFTRAATHSLDPSGRALRWEMMPGWKRLAWRIAILYTLLLAVLCSLLFLGDWVGWDAGGRFAWKVIGWHGFILGSFLVIRYIRRRVHRYGYRIPIPVITEVTKTDEELTELAARGEVTLEELEEAEKPHRRMTLRFIEKDGVWQWQQEKVLPVARAVAGVLNVSWTEKEALKAVTIPRDFKEDGGGRVEVLLPASFTGADAGIQKRLVSTVAARLAIKEPVETWQLEGSAPRVLIGTPPAPPPLVLFEECRRYFEAAEPFTPFYGIIAGGEAMHIGMHSDTPHMAISAGSGAGKSEMIKVLVMQALHWGWSVIILDWKEESQEWAKGLRGVRYCSSEETIHDMLIQIGEEIEWRKTHPGDDRTPMIVVCEEWSMTADLLSEYWSILRSTAEAEERKSMPVRSPALTAAKKIVYTGRSLGVFQLLVAIRFSARVVSGNADLRESFQVILMARYKAQTVQMLAKGIKPFPKNKPKERGRWVAVMGEEAVVFRAPLVTPEEAQEWATSGVQPPMSPFSERYGAGSGRWGTFAPTLGDRPAPEVPAGSSAELPVLEAEAVEIRPRSLSEMLEELQDVDEKITLKILRNAAADPETGFPEMMGVGRHGAFLYDPAAVRMWTSRRYAAKIVKERRK